MFIKNLMLFVMKGKDYDKDDEEMMMSPLALSTSLVI